MTISTVRSLFRIGVAILVCFCTSCIVPYPHRTQFKQGLSGKVMNAKTRMPVSGAIVTASYQYENISVSTQNNGRFQVADEYVQHWLLMLAPTRMSLPGGGGIPQPTGPGQAPTEITISKPGYQTATYERPEEGFQPRSKFALSPIR